MLVSKRFKGSVIGTVGLLALGAALGGCQTQTNSRVTVMNESSASLLVDVAMAGSDNYLHADVPLAQGAVRAFTYEDAGAEGAQVEVGIRPEEFADAAGQWLGFLAAEGPWLLRVQGGPGNLRFLPTRDIAEVRPGDIGPAHDNRLGAEPPVNPR